MNPDLYTEEYRNFKFLKSDPDKVRYFKKSKAGVDKIQAWDNDLDPNFSWKHRIEFVEQVFDLRHDSVYIVSASSNPRTNLWESAKITEIKKPIILSANPIIFSKAREATLDDVTAIENTENHWFCMCEEESFKKNLENDTTIFQGEGIVVRMSSLPVVPSWTRFDFIEMFYNRETAEQFRIVLTDMLRHKIDAMSAFSLKL